ncbi:hypothetical protein BDV96DRAFT_251747 [Lophiotrema nucula]|uniref:Uncharacterized protein n=1 Tax=Lophiotrema nucula TaxID=690887 RepID=A0A6A5YPQ9_9PLEO|nr:hypothetical protein BDV96DRAFT_251747 [Lophiotrema nucula]
MVYQFISGSLRHDTEAGTALIPRSAYRQRLFLCTPASSFRAQLHIQDYGASSSNSCRARFIDDQRHSALARKGRHNEHHIPTLFLPAAWGGTEIDLVSPAFDADDLVSIFLLTLAQKRFLFPCHTPRRASVFSAVFPRADETTLVWCGTRLDDEKVRWIIAHRWRS